MNIPNFINKSIVTETKPKNTILSPISTRISPTLFSQFSNLNFAGVYRIGSEVDKRDCYIGSAYNITLKVTHHMNLLYRGEHHSKELQDWVNEHGLENIDISILRQTKSNPDDFENWEQYFLTTIKPKFNTVLNKKKIVVNIRDSKPSIGYYNTKRTNEFNGSLLSKFNVGNIRKIYTFKEESNADEERKYWKPTIIINMGDELIIKRGDITNIKTKKVIPVEGTKVYRTIFTPKPSQ